MICVALFSGMVFCSTACWYSACACCSMPADVSNETPLLASSALCHITQRCATIACTCAKATGPVAAAAGRGAGASQAITPASIAQPAIA